MRCHARKVDGSSSRCSNEAVVLIGANCRHCGWGEPRRLCLDHHAAKHRLRCTQCYGWLIFSEPVSI